ncbi:hypothetical protein F01_560045 [Burkholderia cenocepacia]|nr:hypothetical protein F01_560045 [Burkholderia cenocepacia]
MQSISWYLWGHPIGLKLGTS